MRVLDHFQTLYQLELYDEVIFLYEMLPSVMESSSPKARAFIHTFAADAYMDERKYALAQRAFYNALQEHTLLSKTIQTPKNLSEVEVRYRLHKCLVYRSMYDEAIEVLSRIQGSHTIAKVNNALAKLQGKDEEDIVKANKHLIALVEDCPLALHAQTILIERGVHFKESFPVIDEVPFTKFWAHSHELFSQRQWMEAVQILTENANLSPRMASLTAGKWLHLMGLPDASITQLEKAFSLDTMQVEGMPTLAMLLTKDEKTKELETLTTKMSEWNDEKMETWIAYGYLARSRNKSNDVVIQLAHRAQSCGCRSISLPFLLKATTFLEMEKYEDAIFLLTEAITYDKDNMDLHEALVKAYLSMNRVDPARQCAMAAVSNTNRLPRATLLHVQSLLKSNRMKDEEVACTMLESVLDENPFFMEAIHIYIDCLVARDKFNTAIKFLQAVTSVTPTAILHNSARRLHLLLGELLTKTENLDGAFNELTTSLIGGEDSTEAMRALEREMAENEAQSHSDIGEITPTLPSRTWSSSMAPAAPRRRTMRRTDT